jgi:hypothetical protein
MGMVNGFGTTFYGVKNRIGDEQYEEYILQIYPATLLSRNKKIWNRIA